MPIVHTEQQLAAITHAGASAVNHALTLGAQDASFQRGAEPDTWTLTFTLAGVPTVVTIEDSEDLADVLPGALVMWFEGKPFGGRPAFTDAPFRSPPGRGAP